MKRKNTWNFYGKKELEEIESLSEEYRDFLNAGKTERECIKRILFQAEKQGYKNLEEIQKQGIVLRPGDKIYVSHMEKAAALFHIGAKPLEEGMNILGAHVDSPRIDVKQVPLFEDSGLAYLDTHYYGGIKHYQWLGIPLALHGIVAKTDGTTVNICIGESDEEEVFVLTDLLPHLGKDIEEKKQKEFIDAEKMDLLIGNRAINQKEIEKRSSVKTAILEILEQKFQIKEEDFLSAELEIVPAGKARECGLDKSMILGYGQDDRSCSFAALQAILNCMEVQRTACALFVDKEEIGSVGATGMHSRFFENAVQVLTEFTKSSHIADKNRILQNSYMLSCDVSAAYDPMYAEYFERQNSAYLSGGVVLNKYTGSGGKAGANDANAEYVAKIRGCFEKNQVIYQTAELGAVDRGGGGTIAYIMASYGMDIIDCGIGVLNMHAPWEVSSKADLYEMNKGYLAFLEEMK